MLFDVLKRKNKFGFSLFEVVVTMAIVAIFLAAASNVFTKRYKKRISISQHGRFECYYDNSGNLIQRQFSNDILAKEADMTSTGYCQFTPPKSAAYLVINTVGGGGAGGSTYGGSAGEYKNTFLNITTHELYLYPGLGSTSTSSSGGSSYVLDHDSSNSSVVTALGGTSDSGTNYVLTDCSVAFTAYSCSINPSCTVDNTDDEVTIEYCPYDNAKKSSSVTLTFNKLFNSIQTEDTTIEDLSKLMLSYSYIEEEEDNEYTIFFVLSYRLEGNFTADQEESGMENYISGLEITDGIAELSPPAGFGGGKGENGGNGAILIVW